LAVTVFAAGQRITAGGLNSLWNEINAPWQTYVVAWTAATTNPTLSNGTLIGRYKRFGTTVHLHVELTIGSTTNVGSGAWIFSLPFPAESGSIGSRIGDAHALGATRWEGQIVISPGTGTFGAFTMANSSTTTLSGIGGAVPFAWTTNNQLRMSASYEVAPA
jgi:hypothetical protein